MWLLLFGLLHGTLLSDGDILALYASVALLFMFPMRHVAPKWLIIAGLSIGIAGGSVGVAQLASAEQAAATADVSISQRVEQGRLPYLQSIAPRTDTFLTGLTTVFRTGYILEIAGSMLLGMGLFKSGFLTGARSRRTYALTAIAGYAISIPIVATGVTMAHAEGFSPPAVTRWLALPYQLEVFPGAIANTSVLLLLFRSRRLGLPFAALANVGRTTFSNYILTSLLCGFVFAWGPWKLYGAIEYYQQMYVIAAIWAINLLASAWWLTRFTYGPLEWGWRSLVYWKRQPLRRM